MYPTQKGYFCIPTSSPGPETDECLQILEHYGRKKNKIHCNGSALLFKTSTKKNRQFKIAVAISSFLTRMFLTSTSYSKTLGAEKSAFSSTNNHRN